MTARTETASILAEEGARVRDYIASNRSDTLLRIFDYLLQQTIAGHTPRESDIAAEVFPLEQNNPVQQRSRVRVGVHRLRRKLEVFYADAPGCQLLIPPGEYALQIRLPAAEVEADVLPQGPARSGNGLRSWALVVAALLALNGVAGWFYVHRSRFADGLSASPLWAGIAADQHPSALVMGDQFAFLVKEPGAADSNLVQDFDIRAPGDLFATLASRPALRDRVTNQDLYTVSASILDAVSRVTAYLRTIELDPVTSAALTPETMQSSPVIAIGRLDEMSNLLRTPLFEASGFRCGPHCFDLVDAASGRRFSSDSPFVLGDSIVPRRDFGYIARLPGPSGHAIVIISGTGDAGVRQAARIVTDPQLIAELRGRVGSDLTSFEALYQVRTMFDQTYGSTLLIARSLNADHIWDKAKPE